MKITNTHTETLEFATVNGNGKVVMEAVKPGESKQIDVKPDDVTLRARINANMISVDSAAARRVAAVENPAS